MQKDERRKDPHQRNSISHAFAQSVVYCSRSNELYITSMSQPFVIVKASQVAFFTFLFWRPRYRVRPLVFPFLCLVLLLRLLLDLSPVQASYSSPCSFCSLSGKPAAFFIYGLFISPSILTTTFMRSASFSTADKLIAVTFLALIAVLGRNNANEVDLVIRNL
uniref:Uncharacterized protein n=1 Tax=Glossina palpalis gambiensis TaxID=67801 RepID=A0A1B0B1G4_9MUSC